MDRTIKRIAVAVYMLLIVRNSNELHRMHRTDSRSRLTQKFENESNRNGTYTQNIYTYVSASEFV